jgi:uncharacterized protein YuzE
MKIRITQDTEAQATYIYLQEGAKFSHTISLPNDVNVDIDTDGNIIGIEVLELVSTLLVHDITNTDTRMPERKLEFDNEGSTE